MDSEGFHSKERLAVERRAQPNTKALAGDSSAASWAHLRQRLSRAEREARAARRVAVVLSCVSLAGIAGVFAVVLPWPPAVGSGWTPGEMRIRERYPPARPSARVPASATPVALRLPRPATTSDRHDAPARQPGNTAHSRYYPRASPRAVPRH